MSARPSATMCRSASAEIDHATLRWRRSSPTNRGPRFVKLASPDCTSKAFAPTIERRTRIGRFGDANERCKASNPPNRLSALFLPPTFATSDMPIRLRKSGRLCCVSASISSMTASKPRVMLWRWLPSPIAESSRVNSSACATSRLATAAIMRPFVGASSLNRRSERATWLSALEVMSLSLPFNREPIAVRRCIALNSIAACVRLVRRSP
jgi:hypothetical protein